MLTIYGASDDLVEVDGTSTQCDEIGCFDSDVLIWFTDGTHIIIHYGKGDLGIWSIRVITEGIAESELSVCNDEDAFPHSDIFKIDAEIARVELSDL